MNENYMYEIYREQVHLSYRESALFQCRFYVANINKFPFFRNI